VKIIGKQAFLGCSSLRSFTVGKYVIILKYAFYKEQ
jgi:hypothetical protein